LYYPCPKCTNKYQLEFFVGTKNDEETGQRLKYSRCEVVLENLKDNEEVNLKKIFLKKFDDHTLVLFDLLNGIEKLCIEDDIDMRCNSSKILRNDDYGREKRKLENTDNALLAKRTTT
jgi:hypothetical protein